MLLHSIRNGSRGVPQHMQDLQLHSDPVLMSESAGLRAHTWPNFKDSQQPDLGARLQFLGCSFEFSIWPAAGAVYLRAVSLLGAGWPALCPTPPC